MEGEVKVNDIIQILRRELTTTEQIKKLEELITLLESEESP